LYVRLYSLVPRLASEIGGVEAIVTTSDERGRVESKNWLDQRERGVISVIRLTSYWVGVFGRNPTRVLVRFIAVYYALFDRVARKASRDWLTRVHGKPATFGQIYGHILRFAQVTIDRLLFVRGSSDIFEIERIGTQALEKQVATGQGAFLLGAHLGSMDAMRAEGQNQQLPVSVVGNFENARMINAVLEALNPELSNQVVHVGRDPIGLALTLRDRIAEGGLIALTADRVGMNDKFVEVDFLGAPAAFSTGPFILASVLKCPIYLVFGLYFEPNRYELLCEPFSDRIELPRRGREEALKEVVSRYAERLEVYCRRAPDNWFNFFDFWASRSAARDESGSDRNAMGQGVGNMDDNTDNTDNTDHTDSTYNTARNTKG
jgi:predicted LPLAT superfamily acyltransferase